MVLTKIRGRWSTTQLPVGRVHHLVTAAFPLLISLTLLQETNLYGWIGLASGLLQSIVLLWGRRQPLVVLALVATIELVTVELDGNVVAFGVIIAGYYAAAWGSGRQRKVALLLGPAFAVYIGLVAALLLGAIIGLGYLAFWVSGRFEASQRGQITELSERSDRLTQERALAEYQAAERERALLARELHDILNHSVTRMVLDAEAGAETGTEADARQTLRRVADTGRDSLAELRRLLGVLRTSTPDDLRPPPSLDQLNELITQLPAGGPLVTLDRRGVARTGDASIELAAYRVVQESLTNVAKHAGAVPTTVRLTYLADTLEIQVSNDLPPSSRPAAVVRGTGLVGLRERVELLGGTLHAGTSDGGGFTVYVTLPLRQPIPSEVDR